VNLIHSPADDILEKGNVDLFLRYGVKVVEASAYMQLTPHVVRYRLAGLRRGPNGQVVCENKIIYKVSRTELAELAMRPAPSAIVSKLLKQGLITEEQAHLAQFVPMADDVAVEADSGGHTDNRPMHVILPLIIAVRDRIQRELNLAHRVRVGTGGGIGCPEAVLAAFRMGAAFVVTGTVNQMSRQAATCDNVRAALAKAKYSDVTMAPAADMFDQGVQLQVLKTGTMFPSRAKKLFDLFCRYSSLDALPENELRKLEKSVFKKSVAEVWKETTNFYVNRVGDHEKIAKAEEDPKLKMSLVFRWYLSKSSGWANRGEQDRVMDYQVWCGPAIGSFNEFIRDSYLDPAVSKEYPCVVQINLQLLRGACYLDRVSNLKAAMRSCDFSDFEGAYFPVGPI
jgi:PfaD family protein